MTLRLEVGKTYLDRDGDKHTIKRKIHMAAYPFETEGILSFTASGEYDITSISSLDLVSEVTEEPFVPKAIAEAPDGGPQAYYDYDAGWVTHNDFLEAKAPQWGVHAWHLSNISKVLMRWGCKGGTTTLYDTKKGLYSFCRVFAVIAGKDALRKYLQSLLDDPQFKE
jgi:hypothetical protein